MIVNTVLYFARKKGPIARFMKFNVIFGCVPMNRHTAEHFEVEALERSSEEEDV